MNNQKARTIRGITAIFWLGFFMAISFMEAPLKFTAPGLTIAEGVQIGRIIFGVLNKCEWSFLLLIITTCFFNRPRKAVLYFIIIAGAILLAETVWLLPKLDIRATQYVSGHQRQGKDIHWIYILLEIVKVPFLFMIGWQELAGKWRSAKT
jgi:hypothetical protein